MVDLAKDNISQFESLNSIAHDITERSMKIQRYTTLRWVALVIYLVAVNISIVIPILLNLEDITFVLIHHVVIIGVTIILLLVLFYPYFVREQKAVIPDGEVLAGLEKKTKHLPKIYHERVPLKILGYVMVPVIIVLVIVIVLVFDLMTRIIIFSTVASLIVMTLVFGELQIYCDQKTLWVHWGPTGKKILLNDILSIRSTSINPLRDFMGYGIRVGMDGAIGYIATGDVGVRVSLKDSKEYVITTNEPQTLVDMVRKYRK